MMTDKNKITETSLVLTTAFVVFFLLSENQLFIFFAVGTGVIGIFIRPLAFFIAKGWFALAEGLNYLVSKVVLGILFFFVLTPISLFYRVFSNDKLYLQKNNITTWQKRRKAYSADDLKNIW